MFGRVEDDGGVKDGGLDEKWSGEMEKEEEEKDMSNDSNSGCGWRSG